MKYSIVLRALGDLLIGLAMCMIAPLAVSYYYQGDADRGEPAAFWISLSLSLAIGLSLRYCNRCDLKSMRLREAFVIVPLAWIVMAAVGCLPFLLTADVLSSYTDAYFETMSGFTTTGATVITDIEAMPRGILLWRSLCHYLGGMGIIVLSVALLSSYGAAGFQMLRAEVPGPTTGRLTPRIAATAKLLWGTYILITVLEILFLWAGEMDLFEAVCHSFSTMATGGFSTRNGSINDFNSSYTHWVITVFMALAGMNFVLHFKLLCGSPLSYFKSAEWRTYMLIILVSGFGFAAVLYHQNFYTDFSTAVRDAFFTVVSIVTSTGFCSANFDIWPNVLRISLLLLMLCGACSGSTGGGLKVVRFMMAFKLGWREVKRLIHPKVYNPIKLDNTIVQDRTLESILGVMILYAFFFVVFALVLSVLLFMSAGNAASAEISNGTSENNAFYFETSVSTVIACMSNIGPGLAGVGATKNYAFFSDFAKWLLSFAMLLGRLEIYSVVILLLPSTWKR